MDSIDIGHVPPPDPKNFWRFEIGIPKNLDTVGKIRLAVLVVEPRQAKVLFLHADHPPLTDWLNLDKPCVALRRITGEPYLTITLRRVEGNHTAFLQLTAAKENIC